MKQSHWDLKTKANPTAEHSELQRVSRSLSVTSSAKSTGLDMR